MTATDIANEVALLESERAELDLHWRRLRYAAVASPEERHASDVALRALEVSYVAVEVALAKIHAESVERRLASIRDVDIDALSKAEADFQAAKTVHDELRNRAQAVYTRRRDAEADLKYAKRTLSEAEFTLQQRRQRQADTEARPIRRPLPAALWVGDHRR